VAVGVQPQRVAVAVDEVVARDVVDEAVAVVVEPVRDFDAAGVSVTLEKPLSDASETSGRAPSQPKRTE
jgi:hypothetical protein